jgi:ankyrin repeat protein
MKRKSVWIGVAALLLLVGIGAAFAIDRVQHFRVETQLRQAIDESQPKNLAEITELVKQGQDIRTTGTQGGTVAMVAAYWNGPVLLQAAVDGGVDPNAVMPADGKTALISAMWAKSVEPTRILLKAGANVNHQNKSGDTALMYAVRNAQFDIIPLLLDAGAKVDLKNAKGETALDLAKSLKRGGPRPMRPGLTAQDFVKLLERGKKG